MTRKLLIAIPSYDTMRAEFVQSLMALTARLHRDRIEHEVKIITGTLVYIARDHLARHAVNQGYTEVLWLDSDMVFSENILEDLSDAGGDIVCGLFISRHNPYLNVLFSCLDPAERITDIPDDRFEISGCGFGCVWMKVEVLQTVMERNGGKCFLPETRLGEDLAFCRRAGAAGYRIYCEPTARVGHTGAVTIWPEDGERLRGEIMNMEGKKLK